VKVNQVKQLLKNLLREEVHVPIMLIGTTGIGKSWLTREVAQEENVPYVDLRLATQEVTDLIGIPRTVDIKGKKRTAWTLPEWFPTEGRGILMLEEVNRAPEDVRQAIFQLITEWKLHTHELPRGWIIVALINPDNGTYHVNALDPAFERRFCQVIVEPPDVTDWVIWARKNNLEENIIKFVMQFPRLLNITENIKLTAKPRHAGYHMLSTLIAHNIIPSGCLHEVASGIIGSEAATTYIQSLKRNFEKNITAKEVLEDYDKVRQKYKQIMSSKRNDLVYMTMVDVIATCELKKSLNNKELDNLHKYLLDSAQETSTTVLLRLPDKIIEKLASFEDLIDKIKALQEELEDV